MYSISKYLLLVSLLLGNALSDYAGFLNPSNGGTEEDYSEAPTWVVGSTMSVRWGTDLDRVTVWIWQEYPALADGTAYYSVLGSNMTSNNKDWDVSVNDFNTTVPTGENIVCYMAIYPPDNEDSYLNSSNYFNISVPAKYRTSTTLPTSTKSSESSSNSQATCDDDGVSTGTAAGIAVGCTVGSVLIMSGLGFFFWKRRSGGSSDAYTQQDDLYPQEPKPNDGGAWVYYPPAGTTQVNNQGLFEASHEREAAEAPTPVPEVHKTQEPIEVP